MVQILGWIAVKKSSRGQRAPWNQGGRHAGSNSGSEGGAAAAACERGICNHGGKGEGLRRTWRAWQLWRYSIEPFKLWTSQSSYMCPVYQTSSLFSCYGNSFRSPFFIPSCFLGAQSPLPANTRTELNQPTYCKWIFVWKTWWPFSFLYF